MGHGKPENRNNPSHFILCDPSAIFAGGSRNGIEQIDWNGRNPKLPYGKDHVNSILHGFPQSHNTAAAHIQSRLHGGFYSRDFIIIGVGGANRREIFSRGLQIIVNSRDTGIF